MAMMLVISPSSHDDISSEQRNSLLNESTDKVNLSSLAFLQTKQRQINHRRNKSEPLITATLEELSSINSLSTTATVLESSSTSTTSNESAMSSNASFEKKRKCSKPNISPVINTKQTNSSQTQQQRPSSSAITKKKKPWYNVSQTKITETV